MRPRSNARNSARHLNSNYGLTKPVSPNIQESSPVGTLRARRSQISLQNHFSSNKNVECPLQQKQGLQEPWDLSDRNLFINPSNMGTGQFHSLKHIQQPRLNQTNKAEKSLLILPEVNLVDKGQRGSTTDGPFGFQAGKILPRNIEQIKVQGNRQASQNISKQFYRIALMYPRIQTLGHSKSRCMFINSKLYPIINTFL